MKAWWFYAVGFLVLAALDTTAHIFFKLSAIAVGPVEFSAGWLVSVAGLPAIYAAIACYIATFFVWMTLLRSAPVGPAFAASHLELVGVLIASTLVFGEHVSPLQWAGAGTILAGIGCLAFSESGR